MKKLLFIGMVLLSFIACSDKVVSQYNDVSILLNNTEAAEHMVFQKRFTDFQLIKLESKENAMLSWVHKLCVSDSGLYLLDYKSPSRIHHFNENGTYICKIGENGKKKNEYLEIFNFSTNSSGDTVVLLDSDRLLFYDNNSKHIKTVKLNERVTDIIFSPSGLLTADYHHTDNNLFELYKNDTPVKKFIQIEKDHLVGSTCSFNFLQQNRQYTVFYDYLSSKFYVLNTKDLSLLKCYTLEADGILSGNNDSLKPKDSSMSTFVTSFILEDSTIIGSIYRKQKKYDFEIEINSDSFSYVKNNVSNYSFAAYHNGYYYKYYSPSDLINIIKNPSKYSMYQMLKKAIDALPDSISERDNYYILKMKKR